MDEQASKRASPRGVATNDLVFSAHQGRNAELFTQILSLYVEQGSLVADVTYGKGAFWRNIPADTYRVLPTDLSTGVDCRSLPYADSHVDCVVLDPPYMHTPGGSAHKNHQNFEEYYKNNKTHSTLKYHDAVLALYIDAAQEAYRVLKDEGMLIVKCQDEVCTNRQRLTHVEIINALSEMGFVCEDLFILMRTGKPGVSRMMKQIHARKNHSYFLVMRKWNGKSMWRGLRGFAPLCEKNRAEEIETGRAS